MPKHTPGPWWLGGPEWPNCVFSQERHATPMVECNYMEGDEEDIANARLISAAPELLQALEEVVSVIEDYCDDHNSDRPTDVTVALPRLREAITKAKGGE
jgi:hypothetical protein